MKNFLIRRYEAHQAQNFRSIDNIAAEAKKEIDNYWATWKARNRLLISAIDVQKQDAEKLGRYAPRLAFVGNAKKLTIDWDDYAPRFKGIAEFVYVQRKRECFRAIVFQNVQSGNGT